ncbi:hypothetical protein phiCP7R_002 [Clostridium phage phiCP7R]|uniref:Uncharacterized protein n=1 Tax=Clostridium phage phiCP7R TaxID=1162304 RepID=I3PV06_9CAUD|nr:hypothetical protein phiCP7R_002 [Clostridium phage phiCP7R]AFH27082.1 hypothetical protein phiCP7R_002 [Clostridium phage phiCP7R]
MNNQGIKNSIKEVAKVLATKWKGHNMSVEYMIDDTMVSFIDEYGVTSIFLKKWIDGNVYGSKVSVPNQYIIEDTAEHFENMIHYCYYNTDFPGCGKVLGE